MIITRSKIAGVANSLVPGATFRMPETGKTLYLTFDDGPHPESTPRILEVLSNHNAKAAFFCLGSAVEKHPALYEMIISQGHSVGNHTYTHPNGWLTGTNKYTTDVKKASSLIGSRLFRPPYGRITPMQYMQLKKDYKIIMWTRQFADYSKKFNPDKVTLANLRGGDILVLHDSPSTIHNTILLLKRVLAGNRSAKI